MSWLVLLAIPFVAVDSWLAAAPVPQAAAHLVAKLNDPSVRVRDEASAALRGRTDALPWLRRAARSTDKDTLRRATDLIAPQEKKRQEVVAKVMEACIKSGQVDLFMEWHHYWQPENKDELWPVGPRMARAAQDEYAKWCPQLEATEFDKRLNMDKAGLKSEFQDGGEADVARRRRRGPKTWYIRSQNWEMWPGHVTFASVSGPAFLDLECGRFFVLGSAFLRSGPPMRQNRVVICDGDYYSGSCTESIHSWRDTIASFVACHADFRGRSVIASTVLVDGDVELFEDGEVKDSHIRASGDIRIPKNIKIVNSKIEPHAKNATAPYKFFELADVGVSLIDDEVGLVVGDIRPGTPFGNSGLKKGDLILAIDDQEPGDTAEFRKKVRRAMVRQGDCLLIVARGHERIDRAVFFPLPK